MPRPYRAVNRKVSTAKRYRRILRSFKPGKYRMTEICHVCEIPYPSLLWMLSERPHRRVLSLPGKQGRPRLVTILPKQDRTSWRRSTPLYYRPPVNKVPSRYGQGRCSHRVEIIPPPAKGPLSP